MESGGSWVLDGLLDQATRSVPTIDFTSPDEVTHQLWVIDDEDLLKKISDGFAALEMTYIADGHHRSASASNVCKLRKEKNPDHNGDEPYNYFLSVIFPDTQLKILPYNRVVTDLNGLDKSAFLEKAAEKFDLTLLEDEIEVDLRAVLIPVLIADVVNPVLFAALIYALGSRRPFALSSALLLGHTAAYLSAGIRTMVTTNVRDYGVFGCFELIRP